MNLPQTPRIFSDNEDLEAETSAAFDMAIDKINTEKNEEFEVEEIEHSTRENNEGWVYSGIAVLKKNEESCRYKLEFWIKEDDDEIVIHTFEQL